MRTAEQVDVDAAAAGTTWHARIAALVLVLAASVVVIGRPAAAAEPLVWSVDGSVDNAGLPAGLAPGVPLGPNVASAKDGSRIEIAGSGEFSPSDRWIDGGGEYRIVSPDGKVLHAGRWKPSALASYRDLGIEHGIPTLIAGVITAPTTLQGIGGKGRLVFYCGAHDGDDELEGVIVSVGATHFGRIESGSTTIERS